MAALLFLENSCASQNKPNDRGVEQAFKACAKASEEIGFSHCSCSYCAPLRCALAFGRSELGFFLSSTRHLPFSARCAPAGRTGLLSAVPAEPGLSSY
jgi:hypothetical protein